jgi:Protein of unknown function (DUF2587)
MTDPGAGAPLEPEAVSPELVDPAAGEGDGRNSVEEPAKVMRVGTMIRQLLDEVRQTPLDEPSRDRLREIYETSIKEIAASVSPDLRDELDRLALPFGEGTPTDSELRIAQAQLVGWLEGLFHGIQATLFAQQMAARNQLEDMRRRLPPGSPEGIPGGPQEGGGTYL